MSFSSAVDVIILAAGASRRFDGVKMLAPLGDQPLLQRAIDEYSGIAGAAVTVVLGAHRDLLEKQINFRGAKIRVNESWEEGMATSVHCAVRHASAECPALLFVAADQVCLTRAHLSDMLDLAGREPGKIVAAHYDGRAGIPALFPRQFWPQLLALTGDKGARDLLANNDAVLMLPMPAAAVDIDTRQDLQRLQHS